MYGHCYRACRDGGVASHRICPRAKISGSDHADHHQAAQEAAVEVAKRPELLEKQGASGALLPGRVLLGDRRQATPAGLSACPEVAEVSPKAPASYRSPNREAGVDGARDRRTCRLDLHSSQRRFLARQHRQRLLRRPTDGQDLPADTRSRFLPEQRNSQQLDSQGADNCGREGKAGYLYLVQPRSHLLLARQATGIRPVA